MAALQPPRLATSCSWTNINAKAEALETAFCQDVLTKSTQADLATQDIARMVQGVGMVLYMYQASQREIEVASTATLSNDGRSTYRLTEECPDGCRREVSATVLDGAVTLVRGDSTRSAETFPLARLKEVTVKRGVFVLSFRGPNGRGTSVGKYTCDDEAAALAAALVACTADRCRAPSKMRRAFKASRVVAKFVLRVGKAVVGCAQGAPEPQEVPQHGVALVKPLEESAVVAPTKVRHCMVRFWGEDTGRGANHRDPLGVDDVVYMNMVDFYLSLQDWASKVCLGQPVILRTLDIVKPCGQEKHRRWRFDANRLIYNIFYDTQGQKVEKTFEHELWHWTSGDVLEIGDYIYRVRVRKIALDDDIKFVLLTPVARKPATPVQVTLGWLGVNPRYVHSDAYRGFWNTVIRSQFAGFISYPKGAEIVRSRLMAVPMLSDGLRPTFHDIVVAWTLWLLNHKADNLESHALGRVSVTVSAARGIEYTVMHTFEPGDAFDARRKSALAAERTLTADETERSLVHVAVAGSFECHAYTETQWSESRAMARLGPTDCKDAWSIRNASDRLFLLNTVAGISGVDVATRQKFLVWSYGHLEYVPESIRSAQSLGDPWMRTVLAPMDTWANEQQGIWARIISQMGGPDKTVSVILMRSIREFVDLCLIHMGGEGDLLPDGNDETLERMGTPRQRESIVRSILDEYKGDHVMRPFVKMENRDDDGRMVSPYAGPGKAPYSGLVHALMSKAIEKLPFVLCGRSPAEVEAKVVSICANAHDLRVVEGDVIRMDGNVHMPQRLVWQGLSVKFEIAAQLMFLEEHRNTVGLESKSSKGVRFCGGVAIPSGVPDTTGNNTMGNGASLYHAKRLEGYSPLEAWHWICNCVVVSGDDSLASQMSPESMGVGIASFGQKPKVKGRHDENFVLLGRMYGTVSSVATGITTNCQDPTRVYDRLTLCVGKLYDVPVRRRRYFDKACAILTQDPHSFGISTIAECVVRAGEKYYGWTRFENFDMNYNVCPGRYSNEPCMWFEEVNRKFWPDHDWDGMITWCEGDHTWEEIERHPDFAPQTETIRTDVTLIVKDCDHTQADFCDLQGNIDKGSDDAVPSVDNPHFPEGTSIADQKKAFKECFDRENKRYLDWSRAEPRPRDFSQALASLRTLIREKTIKSGNDGFMEDPSFIEAVKKHADLKFAERYEARRRLSACMRVSRQKFLDSISAPVTPKAHGDNVVVKTRADDGMGVFPPRSEVAPLRVEKHVEVVRLPDREDPVTGYGRAIFESGCCCWTEVDLSPALIAKMLGLMGSRIVTLPPELQTRESVDAFSYCVPVPLSFPGLFDTGKQYIQRVDWTAERGIHSFKMARLKPQIFQAAKAFRQRAFFGWTAHSDRPGELDAGYEHARAMVIADDVGRRLKRARAASASVSVSVAEQSSAEEVVPVAAAKQQPAVGRVEVRKRLTHPPGIAPASLPPSPPASSASSTRSEESSSDSSWDPVLEHPMAPLRHWKLARFYDFHTDQYFDGENDFPGTLAHLVTLCHDTVYLHHTERTLRKITRWIGGWNPAEYPDYSKWEPLHRAEADAAIAARDLQNVGKKARKRAKFEAAKAAFDEDKRAKDATTKASAQAWKAEISQFFSGRHAAGSSSGPFVSPPSVKLAETAPKEPPVSAAQDPVQAVSPASEQGPKKKRKRRKRRVVVDSAASSSDDKVGGGGRCEQPVLAAMPAAGRASPVETPAVAGRLSLTQAARFLPAEVDWEDPWAAAAAEDPDFQDWPVWHHMHPHWIQWDGDQPDDCWGE